MTQALSPASIIVPTYREAANLETLACRIFAAASASGLEIELIIVDDDSRDGTEEIVAALAADYPVRLIVRREERGLSGAVLRGFSEARFDRFLVMDADLQHPPEIIPALLEQLERGDCDFVTGSRYVEGGGVDEEWPGYRRLASRIACGLARPLMPVSDPMSGLFAIPRRVWEKAESLDPVGYKIALEIFVRGNCRHPIEVPFRFAARDAGQSKFGFCEQIRYLRHLLRLYCFRFPFLGSLAPLALLAVVAAVALLVSWLFGW